MLTTAKHDARHCASSCVHYMVCLYSTPTCTRSNDFTSPPPPVFLYIYQFVIIKYRHVKSVGCWCCQHRFFISNWRWRGAEEKKNEKINVRRINKCCEKNGGKISSWLCGKQVGYLQWQRHLPKADCRYYGIFLVEEYKNHEIIWLMSPHFSQSPPLSFIDHHFRCGSYFFPNPLIDKIGKSGQHKRIKLKTSDVNSLNSPQSHYELSA